MRKAAKKKTQYAVDPFRHVDGRQRCVLRVLSCEAFHLDIQAAAAGGGGSSSAEAAALVNPKP
jgi:hypothetical protein